MESVENNEGLKPIVNKWTSKLNKLGLTNVWIEWNKELNSSDDIFISFSGIDVNNTNFKTWALKNLNKVIASNILIGKIPLKFYGNRIQTNVGVIVKYNFHMEKLPTKDKKQLCKNLDELITVVSGHIFDELKDSNVEQIDNVDNNKFSSLIDSVMYMYDIDDNILMYSILIKNILESVEPNEYDFTYQIQDSKVECTISVTKEQLNSLINDEDVELEGEYILRTTETDDNEVVDNTEKKFADNFTEVEPDELIGKTVYLYDVTDEHYVGESKIESLDQVDDENPESDYEMELVGDLDDFYQFDKKEMIEFLKEEDLYVGDYIISLNKRDEDEL